MQKTDFTLNYTTHSLNSNFLTYGVEQYTMKLMIIIINYKKEDGDKMTLYEGDLAHVYTVKELCIEQSIMRRLEALGLNEGSRVQFLNRKKKGALIIKVRGTRLAIGKKIAQGIEVEEETNERDN